MPWDEGFYLHLSLTLVIKARDTARFAASLLRTQKHNKSNHGNAAMHFLVPSLFGCGESSLASSRRLEPYIPHLTMGA